MKRKIKIDGVLCLSIDFGKIGANSMEIGILIYFYINLAHDICTLSYLTTKEGKILLAKNLLQCLMKP